MESDTRIDDAVMESWKRQPTDLRPISPGDIQGLAKRLERRIARRNLMEYAAGILVCAVFGFYCFLFPSPLVRTGCGLLVAGTFLVMWTLAKKGRVRPVPTDFAILPCLEFHLSELRRQRDLLLSVWSWYLAPLVPGLLVFLVGLFLWTRALPNAGQHEAVVSVTFGLCLALCTLAFVAVGKLNRSAARRLQLEIDSLERLDREPS